MLKTIQHKRSDVAGNKPLLSQVAVGELAINFADRSIYTRDGTVVLELARDVIRSATQPSSPIEGDFWYNSTTNSVSYWDGTAWEDIAVSEDLMDSAGVIEIVTSSDLDMEGNKVLFSNVYPTEGDLPSAATYHGMFAHVHGTGEAYFAHAGNWVQLAQVDSSGDASFAGTVKATAYEETSVTVTSSTGSSILDCTLANVFRHVLTENTTFVFAIPSGDPTDAFGFTLAIKQDAGASGYTVTWPASVMWPNATAPTLSATANAEDQFVFYTHDNGSSWYGFVGGQAFA